MILWQTGTPPEGEKLLIEYRLVNGFSDSLPITCAWRCSSGHWKMESVAALLRERDVEIIRWSTLDAAPDAVGKLENVVREAWPAKRVEVFGTEGHYTISLVREDDELKTSYRTAPTLSGAIEKLCGGTDGP